MADQAERVGAKRADARRNEQAVLAAAAAAFVEHGVDAPVRDIAARAGVGVGTVYRRFATRTDLIVAVYRHQVQECVAAGDTVLAAAGGDPHAALVRWVDQLVELVVTKHGLAEALQAGGEFEGLHAWFLDQLMPVATRLVEDVAAAGADVPVTPYQLMRGIGNLCIGADDDPRYDARAVIALLLDGVRPR